MRWVGRYFGATQTTFGYMTACVAGLDASCPVVRTMPTTTLQVQEGLFAVVFDDPDLTPAQAELISKLLSGLGKVYELRGEAEISAFPAVAGSGPGFMFLLWMG